MLKVLDHIAVVARTFQDADAVLTGSLGLTLDRERSNWPDGVYFESEQTRFYFFDVADSETQIEVLVPDPGSSSGTARFLERRGPAFHHICFGVDDVHEEAERLRAAGLEEVPLPRPPDGRRNVAFLTPDSVLGMLTEIVPLRARFRT